MKPQFDNAEVKAFFKQTAQLGGDSKKIDTKLECDKLAEYLAGNKDNLSDNDYAILDSFVQSSPKNGHKPVQVNNIELDLDVEEGSLSQINIGNGNKNNVVIKNESEKPSIGEGLPTNRTVKSAEGKKTDETTTNLPTSRTVKPAEDKKTKETSVEQQMRNIKSDAPEHAVGLPRNDKKEFKYNIWVDMMPGPGAKRDLNYIKSTVISKIKMFPLGNVDDICKAVNACNSQDEVTRCLESFGIGVTYPC